MVNGIKDQGMCSVCWAFSAVAAIESAYAIKTGKLMSLSEQNLIDCTSGGTEDNKCRLGNSYYALQIAQNNGVMTESDYPYKPNGGKCKFQPNKSVLKIEDMGYNENYSEDDIMHHLGTVGPLSAAVVATPKSFQQYKGGIYSDPECNNYETDHEVVIVGYGTDP